MLRYNETAVPHTLYTRSSENVFQHHMVSILQEQRSDESLLYNVFPDNIILVGRYGFIIIN